MSTYETKFLSYKILMIYKLISLTAVKKYKINVIKIKKH